MRKLAPARIELIDAVVAESEQDGITAGLLEKDEHLTKGTSLSLGSNRPTFLKIQPG